MGQPLRRLAMAQWDVFSSRPLEGNSLAVFLDGRGLTDAEMQAIAKEMNLSETTFILPRDATTERQRGIRVRSWSSPSRGWSRRLRLHDVRIKQRFHRASFSAVEICAGLGSGERTLLRCFFLSRAGRVCFLDRRRPFVRGSLIVRRHDLSG